MSVVTNVPALVAHRALSTNSDSMTRSLERLSSGYRINRAADDAAGLALSEGLRSQVNGLGQALRNTQDGISLVRTADGALEEATSVLQRMRDLAVQAANDGGLNDTAKTAIQKEIGGLKNELSRIAATTTFNGDPLLDGTYQGVFQVGANRGETVTVVIGLPGGGMDVDGLGLASVDVTAASSLTATVTPAVSDDEGVPASGRLSLAGDYTTAGAYPTAFAALSGVISYAGKTFDLGTVDYSGAVTATDYITKLNLAVLPVFGTSHTPFVGTATGLLFTGEVPAAGSVVQDAVALTPRYAGQSGAGEAITMLDGAVESVTSIRAYLGAIENRFEHTISRLGVAAENASAAMSRIRDVDVAWEMMSLTRSQILSQAGTAMLSQAARSGQTILALLN